MFMAKDQDAEKISAGDLPSDFLDKVVWRVLAECEECGTDSMQSVPLGVPEDDLKTKTQVMECQKCIKKTPHKVIQYEQGILINGDTKKRINFMVSLNDFKLLSKAKMGWEESLKKAGKFPKGGITWEIFFNTLFQLEQTLSPEDVMEMMKKAGVKLEDVKE
jgi:hypothetical protein